MKKSLTKILLLMSAVIVLFGTASNVAFAESEHHEHTRGKKVTVRHASCYQDGFCSQDGSCDVNGVCQNGGHCFGKTCTHNSSCAVHNGSCPDITCTHNSNCQVH
ncbi:MAG: hypothetical protein NC331_04040, partial [Lachnospiraceae bacterium]|nr:hypothetical protein [Lachnospiraceae bacterium]MCM1238536.1 hypothetical protein [Lachnospiraceae bacterium]